MAKFHTAGTLDVSTLEVWIRNDQTVHVDFHGEHGRACLTVAHAVKLRDWLNEALGSQPDAAAEQSK